MNLVGKPINWAALVPDSGWGEVSCYVTHWLSLHTNDNVFNQWLDNYPVASDVYGGPDFIAEVINGCVKEIARRQ